MTTLIFNVLMMILVAHVGWEYWKENQRPMAYAVWSITGLCGLFTTLALFFGGVQ